MQARWKGYALLLQQGAVEALLAGAVVGSLVGAAAGGEGGGKRGLCFAVETQRA